MYTAAAAIGQRFIGRRPINQSPRINPTRLLNSLFFSPFFLLFIGLFIDFAEMALDRKKKKKKKFIFLGMRECCCIPIYYPASWFLSIHKAEQSAGSGEALTRASYSRCRSRRRERKKKEQHGSCALEWEPKWIFHSAIASRPGVIVLSLSLGFQLPFFFFPFLFPLSIFLLWGCGRVWFQSVTNRFIKQINELISRVPKLPPIDTSSLYWEITRTSSAGFAHQ